MKPTITIDQQHAYLLSLFGLPDDHHVHYACATLSTASDKTPLLT